MKNITNNDNAIAKNSTFETSLQKENKYNSKNLQIQQLKKCLESDIYSCDFTWSLFQSALNSYRFDSCLRPYPPMFCRNGFKEPTKLKAVSNLVPDMQSLKNTLDENVYPKDMICLLHWVLVRQRDPYLKLIQNKNISIIFNYISEKQLNITPNYIYELIYSKQQEEQWLKRKTNKNDSIYAFHGSRLDNFYSIFKFGLQQHMSCTETLFGAGIYLSSELMLSLTYSPSGTAWKKSMFGSVYSIVALCEIINDTEKVKCQDDSNKERCVNAGSIGGTVPDKYYVVLNSDLVRVRYLLLFKQTRDPKPKKQIASSTSSDHWLRENKIMLMLIFYTFILLMVGFFNSTMWYKYKKAFKNYYFNNEY